MNDSQRIVITGVGAVTALGHDAKTTFDRLVAGDNGITEIPQLKDAGFPVYIGGIVPNLQELFEMYPQAKEYGSRKIAYALKAMDEAMNMAGISTLKGMNSGVYMGVETSRAPFPIIYEFFNRAGRENNSIEYKKFGELCRELYPPQTNHNKVPVFLPQFIARKWEHSGPLMATSNACASSNYAIGEAMRKLRSGRIQIAVTGSADEMLDEYMIIGFSRLKALTHRNDTPDKALRPFDSGRDGFALGEGGAVLVIETLEHAKSRGADVICELRGFGSTSDGLKITACHRQGAWLKEAMIRAINDGGLSIEEVGYVNAHGTSTRLNDASETRAILSLFQDRAKDLLVNSTKSMIGHTIAAAGSIEAVVTALSLKHGIFHPTRNLQSIEEGEEMNYCQDTAVKRDVTAAISNSCGFSGCNSCLTFGRYRD